jgi:cobalt-zinc-cadmium efflux system membrane fusion protein
MKKLMFIVSLFLLTACTDSGEEKINTDIPAPPSMTEESQKTAKAVVLTDKDARILNVQTTVVRKDILEFKLGVPAVVYPSPDNVFVISAPINGIVVSIKAHEGDRVKKNDVLLELESLEFANLVADLLQASAEAEYQKAQYERTLQLYNQKIKSRKELDKSKVDFRRSETVVQASIARLKAVGITDHEIMNWKKDQKSHPHLPIRSPINGVITEHLIDMGQAVESYQKMGMIINNSKVMIKGFVAPEDGSFIQSGDKVNLNMRETDKETLTTEVHNLVPVLDEENRSITINCFYSNPPFWLKPGQNVRMQVAVSTPMPLTYIPVKAIQYEGEQAAVFVKIDDKKYDKRIINIDRLAGDFAIVKDGLEQGSEVAVTQVFALKALSKFGEFAEE